MMSFPDSISNPVTENNVVSTDLVPDIRYQIWVHGSAGDPELEVGLGLDETHDTRPSTSDPSLARPWARGDTAKVSHPLHLLRILVWLPGWISRYACLLALLELRNSKNKPSRKTCTAKHSLRQRQTLQHVREKTTPCTCIFPSIYMCYTYILPFLSAPPNHPWTLFLILSTPYLRMAVSFFDLLVMICFFEILPCTLFLRLRENDDISEILSAMSTFGIKETSFIFSHAPADLVLSTE